MRRLLLLLVAVLLLVFGQAARADDAVAFYIVAHQDDWQLFMNPNAFRDVQTSATKVVFVYLTAGDAGKLDTDGRAQPFYMARESGAKASVTYMADAGKRPSTPSESAEPIAGHTIKRWAYGNTVSYFLRLPDGGPGEDGNPSTGYQSLRRLHSGAVPELTAIDGSATYRGWTDLTGMLRKLVDRERGQASRVSVNLSDTDVERNKRDHSDHQQTTQSVLEAIAGLPCIARVFYLTYVTSTLDENLGASDREVNAGTFAALAQALAAMDYPITGHRRVPAWLNRQYVRTEPGAGSCSP